MAKLTDHKDTKATLLIWGPPKVGKTVLASQFPKPFILDLDNGVSSVKSMRAERSLEFDFDVISIDEAETLDQDFIEICGKSFTKQYAWQKVKKLIEVLSRKMPEDATIIFDNLSRAHEYLINYIQKSTGRFPMQIQDWGTYANEFREIFDYLTSNRTRCNTIVIGHQQNNKDEITQEIHRELILAGQTRDRAPSKVDDYLYMKTTVSGPKNARKITRSLQSVPDPFTPTGSRALIPDMDNPTYEKIKPFLEKHLNRKLGEPVWTP